MNCPVCNRNLAPTLSICPSCGAMMNDSVREDLKDKILIAPKPLKLEVKPNPSLIERSNMPMMTKPKTQTAPKTPAPLAVKTNTTEIIAKPTSPTLVEFQHKNAAVPEWRLQLQNAVRKRVETVNTIGAATATIEAKPVIAVSRVNLQTSGANALKAEYIEESAPVANSNPKLANAMRRIEESRKRFLAEEITESAPKAKEVQSKNYPFYIATKNAEVMPKPVEMAPKPVEMKAPVSTLSSLKAETKTPVNLPLTPKFEDLPIIERKEIEKKEYDTNKLKPLPNSAIISNNLEKVSGDLPKLKNEAKDAPMIKITRVKLDEEEEILELEENEFAETEAENEDLAPFSMRFNAGLFDLIIGSFISLILLAPFMISGGKWLSIAGLLAFLVTSAIVMFIYLTTAIGMFGKSLGMKLFSLETIDIEENDYPTFHQAAVSSSAYLASLALGGIGFLPALFNQERRTAPDLLSGTIVVKEY